MRILQQSYNRFFAGASRQLRRLSTVSVLKTFIRKFADDAFLKRWAWLLLLIVGVLTLTGGTTIMPLVDRDEPRFAQATIEMMETGQWVIPYFNGEYRFDKPPLTYWWMRVNYWLFGTTEFGARLHSLLSGYLCALVIFGFGCRLYDVRAAFLAAFGWLTCLQVMIHSRMAVADMPLILAICLIMWAAYEILEGKRDGEGAANEVSDGGSAPMNRTGSYPETPGPWFWQRAKIKAEKQAGQARSADGGSAPMTATGGTPGDGALPHESPRRYSGWYWVLWIGMGLGFLAKGPLIFFVPLLGWLLWRWVFWRRPRKWLRLQPVTGIIIFLVIIGVWGIPALVQTDGLFWDKGMGEHVVERGFKSFNDRLILPFYYPLTAFLSLMPWIAFAWWGFVKIRRNWDARAAYLISWLLAPVLIFSFYATQLPHYTLPGFAAFFLLLFSPSKEKVETGNWEKAFYWIVNGIWLLVLVALGYVIFSQEFIGPAKSLRLILASAAVLWLGLMGVGFSFRKPSVGQMLFALFAIFVGSYGMAVGMRAASPAVALVQIFEDVPEDTQWRGVYYQEPSLVFYSGDRWKFYPHVDAIMTEQAFAEEAAQPTGTIGLVREWRLEDAARGLIGQDVTAGKDYTGEWEKLGLGYDEIVYLYGLNTARMSWVELMLVRPRAGAK